MYQSKHVIYKAIFKHEQQKESLTYKQNGVVYDQDGYHCISFEVKEYVIEIKFNQDSIILKHGNSILHFNPHKELTQDYKLVVGEVSLTTKVISFEEVEDRVKFKYELYDTSGLVSTVYILIQLLPL